MVSTLAQTVPVADERGSGRVEEVKAMLDRLELISDVAVPQIEELHNLYSFYGDVKPHKLRTNVFAVEMIGKSVVFQSRVAAWDYYLKNKDWLATLALIKPLPF